MHTYIYPLLYLVCKFNSIHISGVYITYFVLPSAGVRVGLQQPSYTVVEGEELVEVCVELSGLIERRVSVNISTVPSGEALGMCTRISEGK